MLLGISGTNGAGKGTVVDYLVGHKGFTHYSVRDEVVKEIERRGLPVNRPNMNEVATQLREAHGPAYYVDLFVTRAKEEGVTDFIIESIRNPFEAKRIKELDGFVIGVDADRNIRYERIIKRASATDLLSFDEWCAQEDREMSSEDPSNPAKMSVHAVLEMADYRLVNDGTMEEFDAKIEGMLEKLAK